MKEKTKQELESYIHEKHYFEERLDELKDILKEIRRIGDETEGKAGRATQMALLETRKEQTERSLEQILSKLGVIENMISRLSSKCRRVIHHRYILGMKHREIAAVMNYSIQRIYQLQSQGIKEYAVLKKGEKDKRPE